MVSRAVKLLAPHVFTQSPRASKKFQDKADRTSNADGSKPYRRSCLSGPSRVQDSENAQTRSAHGTNSTETKTGRAPLADILPKPKAGSKLSKLIARMTSERKKWRRVVDGEKKDSVGDSGGDDERSEEKDRDGSEDGVEDAEEEEDEEITDDEIRLLIEQHQGRRIGTQEAQQRTGAGTEEREPAEGNAIDSGVPEGEGRAWEEYEDETKENLK